MSAKEIQNKTALFSTLLMALLMCFNIFYCYNQLQTVKQSKLENGWNEIEIVLKENQDKALIQAGYIKDNVVRDLNSTYIDNKSRLRYDMDYLDVNNDFLRILNDDIDNKFLNINNDNNDLFFISTWQITDLIDLMGMVITDKSINCRGNGKPRFFNEELIKHYNYELGYNAIDRILKQNKDEIIFWEYLPNNNKNHRKLTSCSLSDLKEIYITEGIEGLRAYEFLTPVYINENTDIFGTQVVNNLGAYDKENRQIIAVQGFSLYDELMKSHKASILVQEKQYEIITIKTTLYGIFGFVFTLIVFASITKVHNLTAELEELGDDKTRRTNE